MAFSACNDENENESYFSFRDRDLERNIPPFSNDPNFELKKSFGKALAKVVSEQEDVRMLIKEEALKQIDYDYDAIYLVIKDKPLNNGNTLNTYLSNFLESDSLALIESRIPTLTIFVPELPEKVFSAALWDTKTEIPEVGIRVMHCNDTPLYNSEGEEYILDGIYIPGIPVIVVKENERITTSDAKLSTRSLAPQSTLPYGLSFIDSSLDNTSTKLNDNVLSSRSVSNSRSSQPDFKALFDAYDAFGSTTEYWQRDNIYYNLTKTNSKGYFNYNMAEHIVGIEAVDAEHVYNAITDQDDPTIIKNQDGSLPGRNSSIRPLDIRKADWTQGNYTFLFKIHAASNAGPSSEMRKIISVAPYDLFEMKVRRVGGGRLPAVYYYDGLEAKMVNLSIPMFEWSLENYSSTIKIVLEEVDPSQTSKSSFTSTYKFATNFSLDPTYGSFKTGLKFGGSSEATYTTTIETTTSQGNDMLGDALVNFGDPIIFSKELVTDRRLIEVGGRGKPDIYEETIRPKYYNTKYNTGYFRIYVAPKNTAPF